MGVVEAIKRLTEKRNREPGGDLGYDWDALNLGIEALKRVKHLRELAREENIRLLPGETKD